MKKEIALFVLILVAILVSAFFGYGWHNDWKKLTSEGLVKKNWIVEGNGTYDYIVFFADKAFKVYTNPEEVDSGAWMFDGKKLELDFVNQTDNRVYTGFEFGRDGSLYLLTDGNRERWVPVKK